MIRCQWASCTVPAVCHEAGFWHCRPHLSEHRRQQQEPRPPIPSRRSPAACGTRAGYLRHRRFDEQPCPSCAAAARSYQQTYQQQRRAGGAS